MAIKTRPMPKLYCSYFAKNPETMVDRGNLSEWSYTYNKSKNIYYLNKPSYKPTGWTTLYVPWVNGRTIINNSNSMFKENKNVTFVDFQHVPSSTNSLYMAFWGCYNIADVRNINNNVTNMSRCFEFIRTNINVKLPPNVLDIYGLFTNAYKLNRPITIPSKVKNMATAFNGCTIFNKPIEIPNKVTNMWGSFQSCSRFNQPVNIPDSVTDLSHTFSNCANFNQSVTIGKGVTSMGGCFTYSNNLSSTITIYSTELGVGRAFQNTPTDKAKTVKIYYEYANGVKTKTYNSIVANSTYKWHGQNGVTVKNMGRAPW